MEIEIISRLVLATFLGAVIGLERKLKRKEAGLQTYSLVSLGTCLFTVISFELFNLFFEKAGIAFDPSRIVQAVATGVGFIGAGVIFRQQSGVVGLTTAAGLWVASAIGMAAGAGLYTMSVLGTLLTLLVLAGFGELEGKVFKKENEPH